MVMPEANPYQPSEFSNERNVQAFRLRMLPAAILGLIGLTVLGWGLLAFFVVADIAFRDYDSSTPGFEQIGNVALMLIATAAFITVGCLMLGAAWNVWKQRFRLAIALLCIVLVLVTFAVAVNTIWG